ncbi:hypothetical protein ACK2GQ_00120 [Clostridioides difficile]
MFKLKATISNIEPKANFKSLKNTLSIFRVIFLISLHSSLKEYPLESKLLIFVFTISE